MKRALLKVVLLSGGLVSFLFSQGQHPDFTSMLVHPQGNNPLDIIDEQGIAGMDFLSDGRLAVVTWGGLKDNTHNDGDVYILSNVQGNDRANITATEIASSLKDPVGLVVVNDTIYVSHKDGIERITVTGNTSRFVNIPFSGNYHEYHFSIIHKDGFLYSTLGQPWTPANSVDRGGMLKVSLATGDMEYIAGGLREANGLGMGPGREFFASDNQGHWLPANKLVHIEEGDYFGFNSNNLTPLYGAQEKPPAVWIPYGDIANSPTQPVFIREGVFAGQMYMGEQTQCRLLRVFLERVNGVWQGVLFRSIEASGLNGPPNRMVYGPDGALYMGQIGSVSGWSSSCNPGFGIERLTPKTSVAFEMKAIRVMDNNTFEIEFTQPVGNSAGTSGNYVVQSWHYIPESNYGAGKQPTQSRSVSNVSVSNDRRKVTMDVNGITLQPNGTVLHFQLENITSQTGENLWYNRAWYTMQENGPADVLGCMDSGYVEYNSNAEYDDGLQCRTEVVGLENKNELLSRRVELQIGKSKILKIKAHLPGEFEIKLFDIVGKEKWSIVQSLSSEQYFDLSNYREGVYFITFLNDGAKYTEKLVLY